jgi:hypothetical protein
MDLLSKSYTNLLFSLISRYYQTQVNQLLFSFLVVLHFLKSSWKTKSCEFVLKTRMRKLRTEELQKGKIYFRKSQQEAYNVAGRIEELKRPANPFQNQLPFVP